MPTPPGQPVLELTIELREVEPRVWRRLLVPGSVRLDKLHRILQAAMGWADCHLHSFEIDGERFGPHDDDEFDEDELDEAMFTVEGAIGSAGQFTYVYDFGDFWVHDVTIERAGEAESSSKHAVCLDGANACPPEDVGGPWGYQRLLSVLADPSHEEHEELSEWIGEPIDPTAFDIALVNAHLQAVR